MADLGSIGANPPGEAICVFCGSSHGRDPAFAETARLLGATLAERGIRLVYGGGGVGLMGETARAALNTDGDVIGIMPRFLAEREVASDTSPLELVDTLHQRKARMAELSDGYIILPGGIGTLEEVVEVMSWARLALHEKPIVFLDVNAYFAGFFTFLAHTIEQGMTPSWVGDMAQRATTVDDAIRRALAPAPKALF